MTSSACLSRFLQRRESERLMRSIPRVEAWSQSGRWWLAAGRCPPSLFISRLQVRTTIGLRPYRIAEDESTILVTHCFRVPL